MTFRSFPLFGGLVAFACLFVFSSCGPATSPAPKPPVASAGTVSAGTSATPPSDPLVELERASAKVSAEPENIDALFHFGVALQGAGKPDSANSVFNSILERDPTNVKALVHNGLALEELHRQPQAEALYRRAIDLAPNDPLPYINLGSLLYFQSKKTFEAKEAFSKAIALAPDNPDAHFNLGVLFADAHLYGEARTEWEKVLSVTSEGPAASLARENLERIRPLFESADSTGAAHP